MQELELNFRDANIQSRIPEGCIINGDYKCVTGLVVQGEIKGGAFAVSNGPLVVLETGKVNGRLSVRGDLYVLGHVECENGVVEGVVYVATSGKIYGSLKADDYKVYAGGVMHGAFGKRD